MESKKQPVTNIEAIAIPSAQGSIADSVAQTPQIKPAEKIGIKQPARLWVIVLLLGWMFDFLFWKQSIGINFALFSTLCLLGGTYLLFAEDTDLCETVFGCYFLSRFLE